jgi:hypothetical protein
VHGLVTCNTTSHGSSGYVLIKGIWYEYDFTISRTVWANALFSFRMGALFSHLATSIISGLIDDDVILVLLGIFWPPLDNLSQSSHMENTSLSAAACRSLSSAIHSCGKLIWSLKCSISSFMVNRSLCWSRVYFTGQHFQILLPKILECLSTNFLLYQRHDCFLRTGKDWYYYTQLNACCCIELCMHRLACVFLFHIYS